MGALKTHPVFKSVPKMLHSPPGERLPASILDFGKKFLCTTSVLSQHIHRLKIHPTPSGSFNNLVEQVAIILTCSTSSDTKL